MRKELKEVKGKMCCLEEGWEAREKRMEERIDEIELRLIKEEKQKEKEKEVKKKEVEEVVKGMMVTWREEVEKAESQGKMIMEESEKEVQKLKRMIENKERRERKNNIVIRGLWNEKKDVRSVGIDFIEKEFEAGDKVKHIRTVGKESREVIIVEMEDWQSKERIMKEKSKLRGRNIFIEHDLTREEREVQRKLREVARREREEGKMVKVGYRKLIVEGKVYKVWNEEKEEIREKENFGVAVVRGK